MLRRKPLILLALVITIIALFSVAEVTAGDTCSGDFTVTFDSVRPGLYGGYIYKYLVSDGNLPVSNLSFMEFAIEAALGVEDENYPKVSYHDPGEGGQNGWAEYVFVGVVTITPMVNKGIVPVEFEVFNMVFDKNTLVIPDETIYEENKLLVNGDIILDDRTNVDYNMQTDKRIFVGEWVKVHGNIFADDDIRIDSYSEIEGDIVGGNDIYLGQRVKIGGKLTVGRDLDVGEDVTIKKGFDAKGWINIRNPIPLIIYFIIYLT